MRLKARCILRRSLIALSALLAIGAAVLWVRCGDLASDEGELIWGGGYGVHSLEGRVFFIVFWNPQWTAANSPSVHFGQHHGYSAGFRSLVVMDKRGHVAGPFGVAALDLPPNVPLLPSVRELMVPHWFLIFLFSLLPAWAFVRWMRVRRRDDPAPEPLACPLCGYDLRATPDRCPECGAVPGDEKPA